MDNSELIIKIIDLLKGQTQKDAQDLLDKIKNILYDNQIIGDLNSIS